MPASSPIINPSGGGGGDQYEEFADLASFPETGEAGTIYVALDTGILYRWTGTVYTELSGAPNYFESVSKNIKSWNYSLNYTGDNLTSIVYTDGVSTITKTLNYTSGDLTSIVLSGDTPSGIDFTKTLTYTDGNLTDIAYS